MNNNDTFKTVRIKRGTWDIRSQNFKKWGTGSRKKLLPPSVIISWVWMYSTVKPSNYNVSNNVVISFLRTIHKLRWQNFGYFCPPPSPLLTGVDIWRPPPSAPVYVDKNIQPRIRDKLIWFFSKSKFLNYSKKIVFVFELIKRIKSSNLSTFTSLWSPPPLVDKCWHLANPPSPLCLST